MARDLDGKLAVVGLGARQDEQAARAFVEEVGIGDALRMVWDPTGDSWEQLGVSAQPAAILLGADGREKRRWFGVLDPADVRAALAS